MKICFISMSSSTNQDGASLSMLNIACELAKRGNEVVLVLSSDKNIEWIRQKEHIKCYIVPAYSMRINILKRRKSTGIKFFIKYMFNYFYMLKAYKILKNENVDLIHINGLNHQMGAQIADKFGIPYVWHIRQLMEEDLGQTIFAKSKVWKYVKKADAVIAISNTVKNKLEKEFHRKIVTVYNGVPIEKYEVEDKDIFNSETAKLILPGRIDPGKGQMDAVKAIEELKVNRKINAELYIVGNIEDRAYEQRIRTYIDKKDLDGNIHILHYAADLRKLRKQCDIGLTCSKNEAFGRVTIENQLAGLLVIGANTGGTTEIIKDNETGLIYKEGDYIDLANKIEYALMHKNEMRIIARYGKEKATQDFSIQRVVDQITEIYDQIIMKK